jgi:hypothetical protein
MQKSEKAHKKSGKSKNFQDLQISRRIKLLIRRKQSLVFTKIHYIFGALSTTAL